MRCCYYLEPGALNDDQYLTMIGDVNSTVTFYWYSEHDTWQTAQAAATQFANIVGGAVLFRPLLYKDFVAQDYQFTEELPAIAPLVSAPPGE